MPEWPSNRVIDLLRDEHKYQTLPPKALNKLLYLVNKECNSRGLDVEIPHFWYLFGTLTVHSPPSANHAATASPQSESSVRPPATTEDQIRSVIRDVLQRYYQSSLEEITDECYEDAPYSVQRDWRTLDKMVKTHLEDYHDYYEVNPSADEMREQVDLVYDRFPVERFPQHEDDRLDWYCTMMRELNGPKPDTQRIMKTNVAFWRIFSLTVAQNHHYSMTEDEVKRVLDISSFEQEREETRETLRGFEKEALDERIEAQGHEPRLDIATDAIVMSALQPELSAVE